MEIMRKNRYRRGMAPRRRRRPRCAEKGAFPSRAGKQLKNATTCILRQWQRDETSAQGDALGKYMGAVGLASLGPAVSYSHFLSAPINLSVFVAYLLLSANFVLGSGGEAKN